MSLTDVPVLAPAPLIARCDETWTLSYCTANAAAAAVNPTTPAMAAVTGVTNANAAAPACFDAGLSAPQTQTWLDGYRVDFYWPELGLVVETDSLRYHRTPFKQASDKRRDNALAGSGLTTLRFTHGQICHEPAYVRTTLMRVARLRRAR